MLPAVKYNQAGENIGEVKLNPAVFGVKANENLVHQVVVAQLNNQRATIANTKTRGLVRGGGKKPWRQKGTGRARAGSIRSPLWRGGGVIFGPTSARNYACKVNKKVKRLALLMVLSDRAAEKGVRIIDALDAIQGKTKNLAQLLKKIDTRNALVVVEKMDRAVALAARNLPDVSVIAADSLNTYDVLAHRALLIVEPALKRIEAVYLKK